MSSFRSLAAGFAVLALLSFPARAADACGQDLRPRLAGEGRLAALEAEAAAVPHGEGRLYRIDRPGTPPSWLFGTMHLSDPRLLALPASGEAALSEARRVVIETTEVLDPAASMAIFFTHPELTNLPSGRTLAEVLTPEQRAQVEPGLAAAGTPFSTVQTLQPWFLSMGLLVPACEAARQAAGKEPLDVALANRAKAMGKEILGLETSLEQLRAMASLSMDLQVASLIATVEMRDEMPDLFETMTALYLEGRIALVTPLTEALMPEDAVPEALRSKYEEFDRRVVVDRNHRMAERLAPILSQGGAFVAVGALHLPGEEGLVTLLAREGYTLTRLD